MIEESRRIWYENGLNPIEFEELTLKQAGEYTEALAEKYNTEFKRNAVLCNGLALQIVSGIASTMNPKCKFIDLEKLYPSFFGNESNSNITDIDVWRRFLGR